MLSSNTGIERNSLIRALSPADLHRLGPHLERVSLNRRDVLVEEDVPINHVHFIESGIASMMTIAPVGRGLEVATIGREGMTGICIILDVDRTPIRTSVQSAGSSLRIAVPDLREAAEASPSLRKILLHFTHTILMQTMATALAAGRYTVDERVARYILMTHDRVDGDEINVTHEQVALLLGTRRSGISVALAVLEGEGMIRASRAAIIVRNREKLISKAGGSYGRSEAEYARVIAA